MTTDSLSQIGYFVKDWAILVNGQLTILPSGQTAAGRTGFIRQANSARHPVSPAAQCFSDRSRQVCGSVKKPSAPGDRHVKKMKN
jgi:hypothetical protein